MTVTPKLKTEEYLRIMFEYGNILKIGLWLLFSFNVLYLHATDWPQWRGTNRDGKSTETGLLKSWPYKGPELLWKVHGLGMGYSSPSIARETIYITGISNDKMEFVTALDLDGKIKWRRIYGPAWEKTYTDARTTPTVENDQLYVISGQGQIVCLKTMPGNEEWAVDGLTEFSGQPGYWGYAESPLIVGERVIFVPGGDKTTVVALNKFSGKTVWTSKSIGDKSAYVSPILIQYHGKQQIVCVTGKYILGVNPDNGHIDWTYDYEQHYNHECGSDKNTNSPIFQDGCLYVTSGYDHGGVKLKLSDTLDSVSLLWMDRTLDVHHGGVVLVDGYLYGSNWITMSRGNWAAISWETGETAFEKKWRSKGAIIYADGMLYCQEDRCGKIALVKAAPDDFSVISAFSVPSIVGLPFAHPVICDGRLYLRRGATLFAYNIRQVCN